MKARAFLFLAAVAVLAIAGPASAQVYWVGSNSTNFGDPGNWSGPFPTGTDAVAAVVNNITNHIPTITSATDLSGFQSTDIDVGTVAGFAGSNDLGGFGQINQIGGSLSSGTSNWVQIGDAGAKGLYNLADTTTVGGTYTGLGMGSGSLTTNTISVGAGPWWSSTAAGAINPPYAGGSGTLNVNTSGVINAPGGLMIGGQGTNNGVVNIDNGTINLGGGAISVAVDSTSGAVAPGASGSFNMGGGVLTANGLSVAGAANSVGAVSIGGNSNVTFVGNGWSPAILGNASGASATMVQSGDSVINLTASYLSLAANASSSASYTLNGGTLNFKQTTGWGSLYLGDNGSGTLNMNGGVLTMNTGIMDGNNSGANGTLNMTAGSLTIQDLNIGNNGGASGIVNLTGGTISLVNSWWGDSIQVGNSGSGTLQIGGNAVIQSTNSKILVLAQNGGSSGYLVQSGNSLLNFTGVAYNSIGAAGTGYYELDGGTLNSNTWWGTQIGDRTGSSGTMTMNGGVFNETGGGFSVGKNGDGILTVNGGTLNTTWFDTGNSSPSTGLTIINSGVVNTNGAMKAGDGNGSSGTITINGGQVNVTNGGLMVWNGAGVINVTGGTVNAPWITLGQDASGNGVLNQTGGVINTPQLWITYNATGQYNLMGGTLNLGLQGFSQGSGSASFYFGGGTLRATAPWNISGGSMLALSVGTAGAIVDSNGNNVAIGSLTTDPNLASLSLIDGGLIKNGDGVLGVYGTNVLAGPIMVNQGTLLITGTNTLPGSVTVKSGAAFGTDSTVGAVAVNTGGTMSEGYTFSNLRQTGIAQPTGLTTQTGATLAFKLSNSAASGNDQIDSSAAVNLASGTVIDVATLLNGYLQAGQSYDLISAPSGITGSAGSLTLVGVPLSRGGIPTLSISGGTALMLNVGAAPPANLVWTGAISRTWDAATSSQAGTKNWLNTGTSASDQFYNLDNVTFTDASAGTVNIPANLSPGSMVITMTSAASSYTFNGPGGILGATGLSLSGAGSLIMNTAGNYTGETDLHGGNVTINAHGSLGDQSGASATYIAGPAAGDVASVTVNSGGTLSGNYIGIADAAGSSGTLTQNGGLLLSSSGLNVGTDGNAVYNLAGGTANVKNGALTQVSAGTGTGALNLSGNAVLNALNGLWIASGTASLGTGSVTQSGTSSVSINAGGSSIGWQALEVGYAGTGSYSISGKSKLTIGGNLPFGQGQPDAAFVLGDSNTAAMAPGVGTFVQSDSSVVNLNVQYASIGAGGVGTYTLNGGTLNIYAPWNFNIGDRTGSSGTLTANGGAINVTGGVHIGKSTGAVGTVTLGGNTVVSLSGNSGFEIGDGGTGTLVQGGNSVIQTVGTNSTFYFSVGAGGVGSYELDGGTLNVSAPWNTNIGDRSGSTGTFTMNGGVVNTTGGVEIGKSSGATGTVVVNGGQFTTDTLRVGDAGTGSLSIGGTNTVAIVTATNSVTLGNTVTTSTGTLNLASNGMLRTGGLTAGAGGGVFTMSGGTLANAPSTNLNVGLPVNMDAGSGQITVSVDAGQTATFQSGASLTGSGGITKAGGGTMIVQANEVTYPGPTIISGGMMQLQTVHPGVALNYSSGTAVNTGTNGGTTAYIGSPTFSTSGGPNGTGVMSLDGTSYLSIKAPVLPNLSGSASYTVGMWINTAQNGSSLLYKGDGNWNSQDETFYLVNDAANGASGPYVGGVQWGGDWVGGSTTLAGSDAVTDGNWHFVSVVRSGGRAEMYVDGNLVQDPAKTGGMGNPEQGTQQIFIGGNGGDHDGALVFTGSMGNAYVYSAGLSAAQIQTLMNATSSAPSFYTNLPSTTALSITASGAGLDLDGAPQSVASLSGVAGSKLVLGGGTLTVNNAGSTTFAGNISDTGGAGSGTGGWLVVNHGGTLTLTGSNTYSGGSLVAHGNLIVANADSIQDGSALVVGNPSVFGIGGVTPAAAPLTAAAAISPVPEPCTWALLATALGSLLLWRRKSGRGL